MPMARLLRFDSSRLWVPVVPTQSDCWTGAARALRMPQEKEEEPKAGGIRSYNTLIIHGEFVQG